MYKIKNVTLFHDDLYWTQVKDGHVAALALHRRHYSKYQYQDGRQTSRFVGPGERIVLIGKNNDALFVWRKEAHRLDKQEGVNCAVFRNESLHRSSSLILQAEEVAWQRWPGERLFTFVNPEKIKSTNPGYCFKMAGWKECGYSKKRNLLILEKYGATT